MWQCDHFCGSAHNRSQRINVIPFIDLHVGLAPPPPGAFFSPALHAAVDADAVFLSVACPISGGVDHSSIKCQYDRHECVSGRSQQRHHRHHRLQIEHSRIAVRTAQCSDVQVGSMRRLVHRCVEIPGGVCSSRVLVGRTSPRARIWKRCTIRLTSRLSRRITHAACLSRPPPLVLRRAAWRTWFDRPRISCGSTST